MIERDPATGFPIFRPDGAVLRAFMRDQTSRVKIIHGYGASPSRSVIREQAIRLMNSLAVKHGEKLVEDRNNPGAHIPWLD